MGVKHRRAAWPAFYHRNQDDGNATMPRKWKTAKTASSAKNCAGRINYAKLKVGEGNDSSELASEALEASDQHLTFRANDQEQQGHGLTGAFAPPRANMRRRACDIMSKDNFDNAPDLGKALGFAIEDGKKLNVYLDVEKYMALVDGLNLSKHQKVQIIRELWNIGLAFYDLGFSLKSFGQPCGKLSPKEDGSATNRRDMVSSRLNTLTKTFNLYAA